MSALDPFAALGVEVRFDLDPAELERRHRDLSRALHPDRHASEPPAQRRMALSRAIEVNEAYRALKDPIRRAERVLAARGVPIGENNEPAASGELLMEMMEAREELADVVRARDAAAVARFGATMRARRAGRLDVLCRALQSDTTENLRLALATLGELRYVKRFLDEVSAFEEALAS
jgi:molecular chaperone HscB